MQTEADFVTSQSQYQPTSCHGGEGWMDGWIYVFSELLTTLLWDVGGGGGISKEREFRSKDQIRDK